MATYEWDENKRARNLLPPPNGHGLDFIDCDPIFEGDHCIAEAAPGNDHVRFIAIGRIHGLYCAAIFTSRGDAIRIISLRRARDGERRKHQALFG